MRTIRAALVVSIVILFGGSALADDAAKVEAKARFRAGAAYFEGKVYDKAIVEFEASYRLSPRSETLFTLAQCYRLKGDNKNAVDYYKRYLNEQPNGRGSPEAREFIAGLEDELSVQREADAKRARELEAQRAALPKPLPPPVVVVEAPPPPAPKRPVVKSWWLWTIVGVAAVGVGVGLGVGLTRPATAPKVDTTDGSFRWSDAK